MKILYRVLIVVMLGVMPCGALLAQDSGRVLPDMQGRIAYIGHDRNVYVLNLEENTVSVMTDDSAIGRRYTWPVWSRGGQLTYFLTMSGVQTATEMYISDDGRSRGTLVYSGDNEAVTYAYWSPARCGDAAECRDIGVLLNNTASVSGSLTLNIMRADVDGAAGGAAGEGAPFYYSWSPDGSRMIWHRNNERFDVYDVNEERIIETLPYQPGWFHAPSWSPVDDRLLLGVRGIDEQATDLIVARDDQVQVLASGLTGLVAFAWSPDGRYVAYSDGQGPIWVIDGSTGMGVSGSGVSGILAFFWSPDGKRLAYLTLASPPGAFVAQAGNGARLAAIPPLQRQSVPDIAWSVLDVEDGTTRRYGAFSPTQEMWFMIFFFDQFGQSHQIWSPDSGYLVYSEINRNNRSVVSLLNARQEDSVPLSVADGLFGIWSFD